MSQIRTLDETSSAASVAPMLAGIKEKMGKVFNFHGTLANSEAAFNAFMAYDQALDARGTLSTAEREAIALGVSELNGASYCLAAHTMVSTMMGLSQNDILALRTGTHADPRLEAIGQFARRVADRRGEVSQGDLDALRAAGCDDGKLVEIYAHTLKHVWTNYFTRAFAIELDMPAAPELGTSVVVEDTLPATPEAIYQAWLTAEGHAQMTGVPGQTVDGKLNGSFACFEGNITGEFVELERNRRIAMKWRASQFPRDARDSRVIVELATDRENSASTRITITHVDIPAGQEAMYRQGWQQFYLTPMRAFFGRGRKSKAGKASQSR